ncbi:MAG: FG-GAP-like repeat-containing protein [Burkholderiales bacterium]
MGSTTWSSIRRLHLPVVLVATGLMTFGSGAAHAVASRWINSGGPDETYVQGITFPTATNVVASVYGSGIFWSADSGATWQQGNAGLPNLQVNFVFRTLEATPVILAAMDGRGVYRSNDFGATWSASNGSGATALKCAFINAGDTHDADPNIVIIGTSCTDTATGGVWKSLDKGATWTFLSGGTSGMPGGLTINDVRTDPNDPTIIYAAVADSGNGTTGGVWKTTNGGTNWTRVNNGITSVFSTLTGVSLNPHSTTSGDVIVQMSDGGVFRTTDGGANWTNVASGLPTSDFIAHGSRPTATPNIVYIGLGNQGAWKGTISGSTISWSLLTSAMPGVRQVNAPDLAPTELWARSYDGLWRSTDGGTNWTRKLPSASPASPLAGPYINDYLFVDYGAGNTAEFATTLDSVYKRLGGAGTWVRKPIPNVTLREGLPNQLAVDVATKTQMYVSTFSNGIYKSVDGGDTWTAANTGLPAGLWRSDASVVADPISPNVAYASFFSGPGGIYKSSDGGANWTNVTTTGLLADSSLGSTRIRQVLIDPTNSNKVYVLTNNGLYNTTDAGVNWAHTTTAFGGSNRQIAFKPGDTSTMYLARINLLADGTADTNTGVWRSGDSGATWTKLKGSFPAFRVAATLEGGKNRVLYAATGYFASQGQGGVWRSIDDGVTWTRYSRGMRSEFVRKFATYTAGGATEVFNAAVQGDGLAYPTRALAGHDFTGDDFHDVLWRDATGVNASWNYTGAAVGSYTTNFLPGVDTSWQIKARGDFDRDGRTDVVWFHPSDGLVAIWIMGSASSISSVAFPASVGGGGNWQLLGAGDFDGDGTDDLVWRDTSTNEIRVWFMHNAAIAQSQSFGVMPSDWQFRGVGDIDGDGLADIVWFHPLDGQVAWWRMRGRALAPITYFPVAVGGGSGWDIARVADLDGDGRSDLLWRNSGNGLVVIHYMALSGVAGFQFLQSVPFAQWRVDAVGDLDNSGTEDLVWYEIATGNVVRWMMPNSRASPPVAEFIGGLGAGWQGLP